MKKIFTNKWVKFGIAATLYLAWVIWLGNYWFLIGLGVIYDVYIQQKVHWAFWKKKGAAKQTPLVEWVDALIFAIIAASFIRLFFIEAFTIPTSSMEKTLLVGDYLFVSKVSYGPKLPNTPISFPFAHHTLPFTTQTKSFVTWIQNPYRRMAGLGQIKHNDIVVFNFPEGDTVVLQHQDMSYYEMRRELGRQRIWQEFDVTYRPVDKRENYIKRCIGLPGDSIRIKSGQVYVNGQLQDKMPDMQYKYIVITDSAELNTKSLQKMGMSIEDIERSRLTPNTYIYPLTEKMRDEISRLPIVHSLNKFERPDGDRAEYIFPHNEGYNWNEDNFGPIQIPAKGMKIALTTKNLPIYHRAIETYEGNTVEVNDSTIKINGQIATEYTFKMNYYWMMGDSRHNSQDSRYWGFVPEDHVVGKAVFIWFSWDKDKSFFTAIRWNRLFQTI